MSLSTRVWFDHEAPNGETYELVLDVEIEPAEDDVGYGGACHYRVETMPKDCPYNSDEILEQLSSHTDAIHAQALSNLE